MLGIKTVGNLRRAIAWAEAAEKQLAFSQSQGINDTAFDVKTAFEKGTLGAFHQPVKFTQKAFLVVKAKKRNLVGVIYAQNAKGKDRNRYLRFGVRGGVRPQKGFERYFEKGVKNDGTIPSGSYFWPGHHVKVNAAGNVTMATLKKIGKGLTGQGTKSRSGSKERGGFFIGTPRNNNLSPGIWRRSREQLFPYFIATTDKPDYKQRFNMQRIGQTVVGRRLVKHTQRHLDKNIKGQLGIA